MIEGKPITKALRMEEHFMAFVNNATGRGECNEEANIEVVEYVKKRKGTKD